MDTKLKNAVNWLLPVFLILFILEVIAFPFAVGLAYAGRSEAPDYILTYRSGKLTWNDGVGIDESGAAQLSLFDAAYENVAAGDGAAVVAPGTEGFHIIRLHNRAEAAMTYTAVLYSIKSSDSLPVEVSLLDGGFTDSQTIILPEGVEAAQCIRCVSGSLQADQIADFDISWLWSYEVGDDQDLIDVNFGNRSANGIADDITVGFYLVVEDDGTVIPPTADLTPVTLYMVLLFVSGAVFVLLLVYRKRENQQA